MNRRGICQGWNVLEIGDGWVAAAFAGMLGADEGAPVIRVELPEGDRLNR